MASSNITSKFLNRMFRKVEGLVWDLTTGQIGIKGNDGIYTLSSAGEGEAAIPQVSVNPFDSLSTAIPAFATNTPLDQVALGDILVGDRDILGWVIEVREHSLKLFDKNGFTKNYTPPKVSVLNTSGVLVVKNLFNLAGGQQGLAGLQNNILPLLAMGGGDAQLEKLLPILLMQSMAPAGAAGAAPAAGGFNPMMLLLLNKKGGKGGLGDIDPLTLMMMSGGMVGGAGGFNPMMLLALQGGLGGDEEPAAPSTLPIPSLLPVTRAR